MIHRAIFGSLERFFGVLTENYAGDFPLWLAPVQMRLLPITEAADAYCAAAAASLRALGLRVEVAPRERLAKLVRNSETDKVPIMAIAGAAEVASGTLTLRARGRGDIGAFTVAQAAEAVGQAVAARKAELGAEARPPAPPAPAEPTPESRG